MVAGIVFEDKGQIEFNHVSLSDWIVWIKRLIGWYQVGGEESFGTKVILA